MLNRQFILIYFILLVTTILGYWAYKSDVQITRFIPPPPEKVESPDFFANNTHLRKFDLNGKLVSELLSDNVSHFQKLDTTLFINPNIWNFSNDTHTWNTVAEHGLLLGDTQTIELKSNVILTRINNTAKKILINTDFLVIYLDKGYAETDRPVQVKSDSGIITAVGVEINYSDNIIHLKSKVRGRYEAI